MNIAIINRSIAISLVLSFSFCNLFQVCEQSDDRRIINDGIAPEDLAVYIVHVQKPDGTKFQLFKHRKAWYTSYLPNCTLFSGEPRLVYAFREVISGFAAWLTQEEVKSMESMQGFLVARRDRELQLRTTYTPKFLGLDSKYGMWYDSKYGSDVIIAVMDSGIKPTHPSFGAHGMTSAPTKWNGTCYWRANPPLCNNKIIGARSNSKSYPSPLDPRGHGTHVASIAAGNFVSNVAEVLGNARGTSAGIAPKAHLAIYKTPSGLALLSSIEEAIRNNVDVINISKGDPIPDFNDNNIVIGSFAAMTKKIVTCAAAPNGGPYEGSMDNDAPWIITVGASSTDRRIVATVVLGNGDEFDGESAYHPKNYNSPQLPLTDVIQCTKQDLNKTDVRGKIVLCLPARDNVQSGENVLKAGGAAMIIPGYSGNTTFAYAHVLPASYVNTYAANEIERYSSSANATAAIVFKGTRFGARPSPAVAYFSGRGPSSYNAGIIKPDVIAPGVNILGAWPKEEGPNRTGTNLTFHFESGTSMATPHVAGLAALLLHNHPLWSPAAIRSAIMTTAKVKDMDDNPIEDQFDGKKASVFATGSGIIDPVAANDPGLLFDIKTNDYIRYLCGSFSKVIHDIVKGNVNCSATRAISAEELNYPSIRVSLSATTTIKVVDRMVTHVGEADTTYTVNFEEPDGVDIKVSPVVLHFDKATEVKNFNVTLSFKTVPMPTGTHSEGQLSWVSGKYLARIPMVVDFK